MFLCKYKTPYRMVDSVIYEKCFFVNRINQKSIIKGIISVFLVLIMCIIKE